MNGERETVIDSGLEFLELRETILGRPKTRSWPCWEMFRVGSYKQLTVKGKDIATSAELIAFRTLRVILHALLLLAN
jgi:hypothetical protein